MDLLITQHNNGEITFNADELRHQIAEFASQYEGLVYTDENIKDAKKDRTEVRKRITAIEDRRKEIKKAYMDGYNKFEKEVKECLEPLTKLETSLKALSDEYEEKRKEKKMNEIKAEFAKIESPFPVSLEAVFRQDWLRATTSMKTVVDDMKGDANNFSANLQILERLPNGFEAAEIYKETLDMARALNEADRLARIQKMKEEQVKEEPPKPEPPKEEPKAEMPSEEPERLVKTVFSVTGTIPQLKLLKAYMDEIGVIYEG